MQFYFIRHAQSKNNWLYDTTGSSNGRSHDPELTEVGQRQAQVLARFLARTNPEAVRQGRDFYNLTGFGITHLYTSLMLRAIATGERVAEALGLALLARPDIHEVGGLYLEDEQTGEKVGQRGSSRAYLAEHFPCLVLPEGYPGSSGSAESGWWNRPFEELEEGEARALRFWGDLLERHGQTQDRVAIISHGGFYNCLAEAIFKIQEPSSWFSLNNTGITRIDVEEGRIKLAYANRIDFLPPELVT